MPPRKDPVTGEIDRPGETFETLEEAEEWRRKENAKLLSKRPSTKITLRQTFERRANKAGLKQTTKADLLRVVGRLPDSLLDSEIRKITPEQITDWVMQDLIKRPFKISTMLTTSAHLSGTFTWARDNGIEVIGNPVKACGASRLIRTYGPDDDEDDDEDYDEWFTHQFGRGPVWTPEQIRAFIESQPEYPYRTLLAFVALQATRRGETIGTRWAGFNPAKRLIRVRTNITWTDTSVIEDTPKGGKRRRVLLDDMVIEMLEGHRIHQAREKAQWDTWDSNDWIFTRRRHHRASEWWPGAHMIPTTITSRVGYGAKKLGFPILGPHGLRRSWATIAERLGVPRKVRRDVLGHSGDTMTERYSRSSAEEIREGLATVRQAIFPDWEG
jgi:integrase